jgi:putative hemolysin
VAALLTDFSFARGPAAAEAFRYPFGPAAPDFAAEAGAYAVRFARDPAELDAVLRLRFEVFNLELGEGLDSSFLTRRDRDSFDATCHHLLVTERATGAAVGTYRLRTAEAARAHGGFYSAGEFDLGSLPPEVLARSVEIGRACVAREHRNKQVLFLLWRGLAAYLRRHRKRYFFGCCSLPTRDAGAGLAALRLLERGGHTHPNYYVTPRRGFQCLADAARATADGGQAGGGAPVELPPLFKTYLRHGAKVCGPPALDREFKTVDFFVLFDAAEADARTRRMFFGEG